MPLVSVVIPTYRHADFILQTLDSVFAQKFTDYETIVINDGSPDDTAASLAPLAKAGKIRYFEQSNGGQAIARNRGIREASGEFVALLDDDDLWPPDKLAWQVESLHQHPRAVGVWGYRVILNDPAQLPKPERAMPADEIQRRVRRRQIMASPGQALFRADALRAVGGYDPSLWGCDDWDMLIRLATLGPLVYSHQLALHYRWHRQNASSNVGRLYANLIKLHRKHHGILPRGGFADWAACLGYIHAYSAKQVLLRAKS